MFVQFKEDYRVTELNPAEKFVCCRDDSLSLLMATSSEDTLDNYSATNGVPQTSLHSRDSFELLSPPPSGGPELEQSWSRKRSLEEVLEEDDIEDYDLESWLSSSASTDIPDSVMHFLKVAFVADKDIINILGCDFPTDQDKQYVKIQSSILSAAGPAI
uniref:Uncharacterized protein n=1 Tax=Amphimedon queenslandica TaxID=400682 RepID=A0A1X7TKE7_AMPQE